MGRTPEWRRRGGCRRLPRGTIAVLGSAVVTVFLTGSETSDDKDKKTEPSPTILTGPHLGGTGPRRTGRGAP